MSPGVPISVTGGFAAGVVPPDGQWLDGDETENLRRHQRQRPHGLRRVLVRHRQRRLYRNSMPFTAGAKPAYTVDMVLIDNILANPGGTPCFTYQTQSAGGVNYVTDVAITLTVRTQNRDAIRATSRPRPRRC